MSAKKTPILSEKELLQSAAAESSARERQASERAEAIKRRREEIHVEAVEAGKSGDVARLEALQAEAAALPTALQLAEAALSGAREVNRANNEKLTAIVREETRGRYRARREEVAAEDEANAQEIREHVTGLGKALMRRERIAAEALSLTRQLADFGEHAPGVRPVHEVLEEGRLALQRAGALEARQVIIPLLP